MGQAHVKRWIDDIMPLVTDDDDPLGTEDFATHKLPLTEAPDAYEKFQKKEDDMIKVVFQPHGPAAAERERLRRLALLRRGAERVLGERFCHSRQVLSAGSAGLV